MTATRVFHRHLQHLPPTAVSGKGVYLTDVGGKQYLDASGGAAVSCLGHGHPDVLAAMHIQIDELAYAHTSFFTTAVSVSTGIAFSYSTRITVPAGSVNSQTLRWAVPV